MSRYIIVSLKSNEVSAEHQRVHNLHNTSEYETFCNLPISKSIFSSAGRKSLLMQKGLWGKRKKIGFFFGGNTTKNNSTNKQRLWRSWPCKLAQWCRELQRVTICTRCFNKKREGCFIVMIWKKYVSFILIQILFELDVQLITIIGFIPFKFVCFNRYHTVQ